MKNIYDRIWADNITRTKIKNPSDWKFLSLFAISMINAFNLILIFLWLRYFEVCDYPHIEVDFFGEGFPGPQLNYAPTFFLIFVAPFFILNYFLIFYRGRYLKLMKKYPNENKHLALKYLIWSMSLVFISCIVVGILRNLD
jgi:hypothetical protein